MTHYDTLGVSPDASDEDIKKAYRKLVMQHHPDRGGDPEKFKRIQLAYETLSSSDKVRALLTCPTSVACSKLTTSNAKFITHPTAIAEAGVRCDGPD
jgi:preprotein translocase subunit Sec63